MATPMINPQQITVGVVGLGLMGCSITTCLLMAGHRVVAVAGLPAPVPARFSQLVIKIIRDLLETPTLNTLLN